MGNLHEGHLSLVGTARTQADKVIASIFVNPLQFGEGEDFEAYPRTPETDSAALEAAGCDLLFAPGVDEMYPDGPSATRLSVGALGDLLCGAHRLGHFDGMATVVAKLLNIVQPDTAVFGKKDYQQLVVIRRFVKDLDIPVKIVGVPTVREADGLALSSRNRYLDRGERGIAPLLNRVLRETAAALQNGNSDYHALCRDAMDRLRQAGFMPDYVEIRNAADLAEPAAETSKLVILAAARLGRARLIDNVEVDLAKS